MKHPKSYPLEHFIGDCCPDDIKSVAEGVVLTLENIVSQYTNKPFLADRGVPEHDVFARITDEEYSDFYDTVCDAAKIAREAFDCEELYDSVCKWRELFGNEFPPAPKPSKSNSSTGFTTRTEKSAAIPEGRFAQMESKQILDKLNQARRALDSLSQVEIMDEWQFDNELNVWYLHLSIVIECETPYFPQKSQWFSLLDRIPKGKN